MIEPELLSPLSLPAIHNMPRHFTASAVIIAQNHILLVHHRRIGAWLPPGGHIEDGEMPHECAIRETMEETGVEIEVISPTMPVTNDPDAFILPSPLCVHAVKATEKGVDYYHIDMVFLGRAKQSTDLPLINHTDDVYAAKWFALDKLDEVPLAKNVVEVVSLAAKLPERLLP
ncbi:MAG TPA: NUDIX domain-containing protein [Drouetiella sp.]